MPILTADSAAVETTAAQVKGWSAALNARDPDRIVSFYSPDAVGYDATFSPGFFQNYGAINGFYHSEFASFDWKPKSFFVSGDGQFAASLGIYTDVNGTAPDVILLEFKSGKIVKDTRYYGGAAGHPLPVQAIPDSASQPDPSNAARTNAALTAWKAAFTNRDIKSFLSFYAGQAHYIDVIDPQWRVFSKSELDKEMAARFDSSNFKSTLGNFFVSANGHFAAVQGVYRDQKTANITMVIILEVENSKIIGQYNYLLYLETQ